MYTGYSCCASSTWTPHVVTVLANLDTIHHRPRFSLAIRLIFAYLLLLLRLIQSLIIRVTIIQLFKFSTILLLKFTFVYEYQLSSLASLFTNPLFVNILVYFVDVSFVFHGFHRFQQIR